MNKLASYFLYCFLFVAATACGSLPLLTEDDQIFLNDIAQIKNKITQHEVIDLRNQYYIFGPKRDHPEDAEFLFFGETHADQEILLLNAKTIQRLMKPGDAYLFEGDNVGTKVFSCPRTELFSIYVIGAYNKSHPKYDYSTFNQFSATQASRYQNVFAAYENGAGLMVQSADCRYWDDQIAFGFGHVFYGLRARNSTMVIALGQNTAPGKKVFVRAGALHLPAYDYLHATQIFLAGGVPTQKSAREFFQYIKANDANIPANFSIGATVDIYRYLNGEFDANRRQKNFAILLPKKLLDHEGLSTLMPQYDAN